MRGKGIQLSDVTLPISTLLVCGLAVLFLILTSRVIQLRIRCRVSLGDGGNPELHRAIRAQGNLVEVAPLFVLLVLVGEMQGAAALWLGPLAAAFLVGRAMHGSCLAFLKSNMFLRSGGMILSLIPMIAMIVVDLAVVVSG